MNVICVLVNNIEWFKIMLDNMPEEVNDSIKNNKCAFVIFNEQRIGDKVKEIKSILENNKDKLIKAKVIGSNLVINKFIEKTGCDTSFLRNYTMGMNILMQWFIFTYLKNANEILSLDDDIILQNDICNIFEGLSKFKIDKLRTANYAKLNNQSKEMVKQLQDLFNDECDIKKFYKSYVNGGHFILCKNDIDIKNYEDALIRFFNNDFLESLWNKRRKYTSYQFDEKFITALAIHNNNENNLMNKDVCMFCLKNKNIKDITIMNQLKSKKVIHVCNNSGKVLLYDRIKMMKEKMEDGSNA